VLHAQALTLIDTGEIELEPNTAFVVQEECSGCRTCLTMCPYNAISRDEVKQKPSSMKRSAKDAVHACSMSIRALKQNLFEDEMIFSELMSLTMTEVVVEREHGEEIMASNSQDGSTIKDGNSHHCFFSVTGALHCGGSCRRLASANTHQMPYRPRNVLGADRSTIYSGCICKRADGVLLAGVIRDCHYMEGTIRPFGACNCSNECLRTWGSKNSAFVWNGSPL